MSNPSTPVVPSFTNLGLEDDEERALRRLFTVATLQSIGLQNDEAYYLGSQIVKNLRIAIPKELEFLNTVLGWGSVAVDPIVERLSVDGFRLPDSTDADEYLADLWDSSQMGSEQALAFTDALSLRRSYGWVGKGEDGGTRITVESPLNMTVLWSPDGQRPEAALQAYRTDDLREFATLILPRKTVSLAKSESTKGWEIVERDVHKFDFVPVVRIANRARTTDRDGASEITIPMRSTIDSACRDLLGLEVSRELYSVPQKVILGATEADFVKADGTPKSGWDTYITKVLGLERDEEGNLPELKQLTPFSPSVFTEILKFRASQFAGMAAATPQDLGLYTEGNPTSAEALQVSESRRNQRARLKQRMFSAPLVRLMQYAVMYDNGGELPAQYARMSVDWADMNIPNINSVADGLTKLVTSGSIPATSDVTLKRAGFNAAERRRLEEDRQVEASTTAAQQIAAAFTQSQAPKAAPGQQPEQPQAPAEEPAGGQPSA